MNLFIQVTEIISRSIEWQDEIRPEFRLKEDLEIDSLDAIMIVNEIEDEFEVVVEPGEINCLGTVQDIVEKIREKQGITATA